MRLKVIQIRKPSVVSPNGNIGSQYTETSVVDAKTNEPLLGVQGIVLNVTRDGTVMTLTVLDPNVEIRDELAGENSPPRL